MRLTENDYMNPADRNMLNQILTYLEGTHPSFDVKIESIRIKIKGWLIEFRVAPRGDPDTIAQRSAFFVIDKDMVVHCVWDQPCECLIITGE